MELEKKVSESKGRKYIVSVVLAPFCAMQCTKSPRYLEGVKKETESSGIGAGKPNVRFRALQCPEKILEITDYYRWLLLKAVKLGRSSLCNMLQDLYYKR